MYYILDCDFERYEGVVGYDIPEVWRDHPIYETDRIEVQLPPPVFYINKNKPMPDFLVNTDCFLLVNDKLKEILWKFAPDTLQFLEAIVLDKRTKTSEGKYYYVRILTKVECIDREKSILTYNVRNSIRGCKSLTLDKSKIDDKAIFRLGEIGIAVIVREDLKREIENAKCTGLKFLKPEESRI